MIITKNDIGKKLLIDGKVFTISYIDDDPDYYEIEDSLPIKAINEYSLGKWFTKDGRVLYSDGSFTQAEWYEP